MSGALTLRSNLISLIITGGVTAIAVLLRDTLTLANFTMIYLLAVFVIAIRWGTRTALLASFISFLNINFFLIKPFYTLVVADPKELVDLCVFLIIAALAGELGSRARQRAEDAQLRAAEQEILYKLTRSFYPLMTSKGVYDALKQVLLEDLGAKNVAILPSSEPKPQSEQVFHYLLLQSGGQIYATLRVTFGKTSTPQQTRLVNTCATQAAMALNRIDLAERARKSQEFQDADRLKTAILHAVSHDLRTPITIIKSSASNLKMLHDKLSLAERDEITETIENEANQLDQLIGNLLDMSRLKAGAVKLNQEPNSLEEVVGDVAARVWQLTRQERIRINFPDNLPLVNFDYGLLLQAISNIVDNALRYEPQESKIEIAGCIQGSEARITIVNHGENIPRAERDHIMEPFHQTSGGSHVGLGLPIAKGIVEAHGGKLVIEDTMKQGATFVIVLPWKEEVIRHEVENPGG